MPKNNVDIMDAALCFGTGFIAGFIMYVNSDNVWWDNSGRKLDEHPINKPNKTKKSEPKKSDKNMNALNAGADQDNTDGHVDIAVEWVDFND